MVALSDIQAFGLQVGKELCAERVILFGSYARGRTDEDSDVDILVIAPYRGKSVDTSVAIRLKLRPSFPMDLLVRSPAQVKERLAAGDMFLQDIVEHGTVLYEAPNG